MDIEQMIHEARHNWYAMNNREPDAILMHPKTVRELVSTVLSYSNIPLPSGKYKYYGLDIIESFDIEENEVRVAKTKP